MPKLTIKPERTPEATKVKEDLIKELLTKEIELVAVIQYYYRIQDLNR